MLQKMPEVTKHEFWQEFETIPVSPKRRTPLGMRFGYHDERVLASLASVVDDTIWVSVKTTRSTTGISLREAVRSGGNEVNGRIDFGRKPYRRARTSLGVPIEGIIEFNPSRGIEINGRCHDRFWTEPRRG